MQFYYISHSGTRLNFYEAPYYLNDTDLLSYEWGYETENNKIQSITKDATDKSLEIYVMPEFGIENRNTVMRQAADYLLSILDADVAEKKPGRLYTDTGYYLECLFVKSEKSDWNMGINFMFNSFTLLVPRPVWVRETTYSFLAEAADPITILPGEEETEQVITMEEEAVFPEFPYDFAVRQGGRTYPIFDYPYDYKRVKGMRQINNDSYLPCHFKMTIYGPVTDPELVIANHIYRVDTTVFTSERLEIDSRNNTVIKIGRLGEETDMYNSRYKLQSVFEKIPPGRHTVTWPGGYGIDITLYDERSEPRWSS